MRGPCVALAVAALLASASGCKAAIGDAPHGRDDADGGVRDGGAHDGTAADAVPDAPLGMFSTPAVIPVAGTTLAEDDPVLSSDGLELIFAVDNTATGTSKDLYRATRTATTAAFGTPAKLTQLDSAAAEESPRLSADDLTLWYASGGQVMAAVRTTTADAFAAGTPLAFANATGQTQKWFHACADGYYLVSRTNAPNGQDFFEGTVGAPTTGAVTELNSTANEISTFLTDDCLTVYFASNRAVGSANPVHIYKSTRPDEHTAWSAPVGVTDFGVTVDDEDLYISDHGHIAVLASTRGTTGSKDVFESTR